MKIHKIDSSQNPKVPIMRIQLNGWTVVALACTQGDRIGRFFSLIGWLFSFGIFWKLQKPKYLNCLKLCIKFDKKMGWATFWAIFSKTHLVTLLAPSLVWQALLTRQQRCRQSSCPQEINCGQKLSIEARCYIQNLLNSHCKLKQGKIERFLKVFEVTLHNSE
jgi:hypothetical protein